MSRHVTVYMCRQTCLHCREVAPVFTYIRLCRMCKSRVCAGVKCFRQSRTKLVLPMIDPNRQHCKKSTCAPAMKDSMVAITVWTCMLSKCAENTFSKSIRNMYRHKCWYDPIRVMCMPSALLCFLLWRCLAGCRSVRAH